jgi:hypothetical protein
MTWRALSSLCWLWAVVLHDRRAAAAGAAAAGGGGDPGGGLVSVRTGLEPAALHRVLRALVLPVAVV